MEGEITKEKAIDLINFDNKGMVHTFINNPIGLIGADHTKDSILKSIDKAWKVCKTGTQALCMSHGLVIIPKEHCNQSDLLFVETKEDFNKKELAKISNK